MKKVLLYPALACLSAGLLGLVGCSQRGTDFAHMTKAQQIEATKHPDPRSAAIAEKMRESMQASMKNRTPAPHIAPQPAVGH